MATVVDLCYEQRISYAQADLGYTDFHRLSIISAVKVNNSLL